MLILRITIARHCESKGSQSDVSDSHIRVFAIISADSANLGVV